MTARTWHLYRLDDGLLTGQSLMVEDDDAALLQANTPAGCGAIAGVIDWQSQRVDTDTGQLVDWQPAAPASSELVSWEWDAAVRRWLPVPTVAAEAAQVRAERDRRLSACDWVTLRALELGQPVPSDWVSYRQALRAVPDQPGFPAEVTWPTPPA